MAVFALLGAVQDSNGRARPAPAANTAARPATQTVVDTGLMRSELVSLVDDEEAESEAPPSPEPLSPGSAPAAAPPVQHSPRCPAGMLEVDGLYCKNLLHRCIKGGKDYKGQPSPDPEPYYCDEFAVGAAKCFSPEEKKRFCIDEYEYPNRKGAIPRVMVSWYEAKRRCEELGKRLCGDDEWNLACEGPERLPYVYGWKRDRSACNIDKRWLKPNDGILANKGVSPERLQEEVDRLSKRVPSGSMPRCRSPYGVMDMGGNVDEWTVNVTWKGKPHKSLLKGGHWMGGARNRCRPVTARHGETTSYYAQGFRCCADPTMTEQAPPATEGTAGER
ncbi:MAG: SUMF1/EgtB/PvdO family nonheme iron enzyme [Polyangiaceae bacterium]|nr:SUMF1/EgtB/PvdO family nonheme iron enzyme [Polyangiaceae bacterium]